MSDKVRVTVSLDADVVEAIDAIADEYSLARSRIIRDYLADALDDDLDAAIRDAIPEATRELAIKQRQMDRLMDRQELAERRASWKDRTKGQFRKRIEGDAAYDLDGMSELADGYFEDAQIWMDDDENIAEARELVDTWMDYYRAGYWAREHADAVETEICDDDVAGWFEVGEDVHTLRSRIEDVEDVIRSIADGDAYDSDAVVDAVASRFTVCEGAVRLLIELMIEDGSTVQEAILRGGDALGSATAAAGRLGAGSPSSSSSERALTDGDGRRGDDVEDDSEDVVVIDGERIPREALDDPIVATGGATDRSEAVEVSRANGHASRSDSDEVIDD